MGTVPCPIKCTDHCSRLASRRFPRVQPFSQFSARLVQAAGTSCPVFFMRKSTYATKLGRMTTASNLLRALLRATPLLVASTLASTLGCSFGTTPPAEFVAHSSAAVEYIPFDSEHPEAGQYGVLSGDPQSEGSQVFFVYGPGEGAMHHHSSNYKAVVIEGTAKHWLEGEQVKDAPELPPGSTWFQPAVQRHADTCVTKRCVVLVMWFGVMD